jgi:hypothetical protein
MISALQSPRLAAITMRPLPIERDNLLRFSFFGMRGKQS